MRYAIHLHQDGGDIQNLGESNSLEVITQLWQDAKLDDDYSPMDEELTLRDFINQDDGYGEMIDCYVILPSQQNF